MMDTNVTILNQLKTQDREYKEQLIKCIQSKHNEDIIKDILVRYINFIIKYNLRYKLPSHYHPLNILRSLTKAISNYHKVNLLGLPEYFYKLVYILLNPFFNPLLNNDIVTYFNRILKSYNLDNRPTLNYSGVSFVELNLSNGQRKGLDELLAKFDDVLDQTNHICYVYNNITTLDELMFIGYSFQHRQYRLDTLLLDNRIKKLTKVNSRADTCKIMDKPNNDDILEKMEQNINKDSNAIKLIHEPINIEENQSLQLSIESNNIAHNFNIQQKIGQGTYGKVYKCVNSQNEIKILKVQKKKYSLIEYDNLKCIQNMKRQRDGKSTDNVYQIVNKLYFNDFNSLLIAEYYNFPTLLVCINQHIHQHKKMDLFDIESIMNNLISATKNLHSKKMLHNDIKVDNVLYNPNNKQIKLIDFGKAVNLNYYEDDNIVFKNCNIDVLKGIQRFSLHQQELNKNWLYHEDLFGLASILFTMVHFQHLIKFIKLDDKYVPEPRFHLNARWNTIFDCLIYPDAFIVQIALLFKVEYDFSMFQFNKYFYLGLQSLL